MPKSFLPTTKEEMLSRGWKELDILLVSGDAYVDHPSYGTAVIGRVLEDAGFKVGIIAQPDWRSANDFIRMGKPGLFIGVTAGNLDSMVVNYTANIRKRKNDDFSPGDAFRARPDRATVVYTNRIKEAFPGIPVIIGGIEASLRRLAHYDYWSDSVKRSILLDSKADMLVYGMGENQILEIARSLSQGADISALLNLEGTVKVKSSLNEIENFVEIPSYEEVLSDRNAFNRAFRIIYEENDPVRGRTVVQKHAQRFVIQSPPAKPLSSKELDSIYELHYERDYHPSYKRRGGVQGLETVKYSVISHRGCPGECSFCSLAFHQGRIIQSRSRGSILREIDAISKQKDFKGTITDIGGPTANLYEASCKLWERKGACKNKKCLHPEKCESLELGYRKEIELMTAAKKIKGIKHLFTGSGVRHDILTEKYADEYLYNLCKNHVSGQLKVAPEHCSNEILDLMNKSSIEKYERFSEKYAEVNKKLNKNQFLVHYFITAHPGSTLKDALDLSLYLKKRGIYPEQIQDFIPLPMTLSGCMYHTGTHPFSGKKVHVPKTMQERKMQRALIQYKDPKNKQLLREALRKLGKQNLIPTFLK